MKQIALTIEQMKHLKELGVDTSSASMHYQFLPTTKGRIDGTGELSNKPTLFVRSAMEPKHPTFTLQDIIEILPDKIKDKKGMRPFHPALVHANGGYVYSIQRASWDCLVGTHTEKSPLDAAYSILCWCAENGHLKNKEESK